MTSYLSCKIETYLLGSNGDFATSKKQPAAVIIVFQLNITPRRAQKRFAWATITGTDFSGNTSRGKKGRSVEEPSEIMLRYLDLPLVPTV